LLNPDAARAELTLGPGKQAAPRRIVQVNIVLVRKHELDLTQGILRAGFLHQLVREVVPIQ
jgi:hypothetical protein